MHKYIIALCLLGFIFSCKQDSPERALEKIDIRLSGDPQRIHPVFAPTTLGREVFQYIYLPLADFHPESLELTPILIKEIPEGRVVISEAGDTLLAYDIEFREDARWSDGTDLSNRDYVFTVNAVKHELSKANLWRAYFNFFKDVVPDPEDENKLTVFVDGSYMLAKELTVTINLLPSHVYDKDNLISSIPVRQITEPGVISPDSIAGNFFDAFNNSMNEKTGVVQLGPYQLTDFQSDQYIVLEKIKDYWGAAYPDNPFLQAHADQLIFRVVPDELTAVTMAKESKLDFVSFREADAFLSFRDDESYSEQWSFHTPQLIRYYYIAMNNHSGLLSDVNVRKALAHSVNVDDFIQNLDGGLGVRTIGHFHPTKSYYNDRLEPIDKNLEKASEYLAASGWTDSDGDGILDKEIDGTKTPLKLDILITGSQLSKTMALIMQESAKSIGVDLGITAKPTPVMRKENLNNFNYDMAALVVSQDAAPDDPYSRWHSDNAIEGGSNSVGYANAQADSLIEIIRTTRDLDIRHEAYITLQEVMYEDQPVIWLYCPLQKFAISTRLDASTTPKRPGYLANTFTLAEN